MKVKFEDRPMNIRWSNYTKPTPRNLKRMMEFWKGIFVILTGSSILNKNEGWVSITILLIGYAIDRFIKFFAYVEEDQAKEHKKEEVHEEA